MLCGWNVWVITGVAMIYSTLVSYGNSDVAEPKLMKTQSVYVDENKHELSDIVGVGFFHFFSFSYSFHAKKNKLAYYYRLMLMNL